ncbi:MAG TPA: GNAT family N-acetyltransferase [Leucothrix mucor]|nr:GNAT family N-acetyltransferase [Leucothrix mucor]
MDIQILNKDQSFDKLADAEFIAQWKALSKQSSDFSLIQECGFVTSWYASYRNKYDPILLLAYDQKEELVGILPLALHQQEKSISHAGDDQAEYAGWVCKQGHQEEFLILSLIQLKQKFGLKKWQWGWLPPHTNIDCLQSEKLKDHGIYINLSAYESPIYNLKDSARIKKLRKSKSIRSNINRLKRSGDLRVERITDVKVAKEIFIDLKKKANFRNLAAYNNIPFEDDKNKEHWHLDHLASGEGAHFTVLWQGDELLACNFGFCSDDTVMMGLVTYNPVQGEYSPGSIFLIMLIEFLTEEGFHYLDLTPGGDPYKERFCNAHQTLYKAVFCFSQVCKFKDDLLTSVKNKIKQKYSYRDLVQIKSTVEKKVKGLLAYDSDQLFNKNNELFKYTTGVDNTEALNIRVQKYDDLLLYKNTKGYKQHKDIVFSALRSFERGDTLYSLLNEGELVAFVWRSTSGRKHLDSQINDLTNALGNETLLYGLYCLRGNNENKVLISFLQNVMQLISLESATDSYLLKPSAISANLILEAGLTPISLMEVGVAATV